MSDEDKTRILTRKKLQDHRPPPSLVGDKIVFFCPNGDRIAVPAKLAGKRGTCTKCKTPVVIPSVPGAGKHVEEEVGQTPPPVFGPVDEPAVEEVAAEQIFPAEAPAVEEPLELATALEPGTPGEPAEAVSDSQTGMDLADSAAGSAHAWEGLQPPAGDLADHPVALLVARLWAERSHGGVVEIHLANGSVLRPDSYELDWSRGTHGLFANQTSERKVSLTAVRWDTVEKIVVREVDGLPQDMFATE